MSKNIDLSQPGGFPWFDDYFAFMQTAWQEVVTQLLAQGVNGSSPAILSGIVSTAGAGVVNVSAGWFVYNGEAVYFPAASYATPIAAGQAVYVVVTHTSSPTAEAYFDGSTPNVIQDSTGVLTVLPNTTAIDNTHFLLSSLAPWRIPEAITTRANLLGAANENNFTKDTTYICTHLRTGADTAFNLDLTGAVPGVVNTYYAPPDSAASVGFNITTTATIISSVDPFVMNKAQQVKVKYHGKVGGVDYISVSVTTWFP